MSATLKPYILFIGYGHLAKSLLTTKILKNNLIHFINSKNKVHSINNKKMFNKEIYYDYIFLLVRPNVFKKEYKRFEKYVKSKTVIVSCMAGINIDYISKKLESKKIIRIMPNLMAKYSLSQTMIYSRNKKILNGNFYKIIKCFGTIINSKNEDEINLATAIYGSGPAFIAYIINSFLLASQSISKKSKINDIDLINLFNSVLSLNKNSKDLQKFINSIAIKKGTTQAGIKFLKSQNLKKLIYMTLDRAYKRAKEIGIEK